MANDITKNPWILDTAADNIVAPGTGKPIRPKLIVWSGCTTAGHTASIEDGNEVEKFTLSGTGNGDCKILPLDKVDVELDGLSLGALGSGKVYIYF